jgi:hypothetical protein
LSIDPLAALAKTQQQLQDRLLELAESNSPDLQAPWNAAIYALKGGPLYEPKKKGVPMDPQQWLVIVTCRDEPHQVDLLKRSQNGGLPCRALLG